MNWQNGSPIDLLKVAIRKSGSFWGLEGRVRWLLLQALMLLPMVTLSLKYGGLKYTQARLMRWFAIAQPSPETLLSAKGDRLFQVIKTTQAVQLATKYCQPWAKCLQKSLVLWGLLHSQGIESQLRIGVRREEEAFEAHAWVEWEGFALNDAQDVRDRFATFERPIRINLP